MYVGPKYFELVTIMMFIAIFLILSHLYLYFTFFFTGINRYIT